MSCVCVSVLLFCCSVSSLFLSCVLCACDLLIVSKLWHLRAGYPASNLETFLKQGATRIYIHALVSTPVDRHGRLEHLSTGTGGGPALK